MGLSSTVNSGDSSSYLCSTPACIVFLFKMSFFRIKPDCISQSISSCLKHNPKFPDLSDLVLNIATSRIFSEREQCRMAIPVTVGVVGTSWWADAMHLPALASHPLAKI